MRGAFALRVSCAALLLRLLGCFSTRRITFNIRISDRLWRREAGAKLCKFFCLHISVSNGISTSLSARMGFRNRCRGSGSTRGRKSDAGESTHTTALPVGRNFSRVSVTAAAAVATATPGRKCNPARIDSVSRGGNKHRQPSSQPTQ